MTDRQTNCPFLPNFGQPTTGTSQQDGELPQQIQRQNDDLPQDEEAGGHSA